MVILLRWPLTFGRCHLVPFPGSEKNKLKKRWEEKYGTTTIEKEDPPEFHEYGSNREDKSSSSTCQPPAKFPGFDTLP